MPAMQTLPSAGAKAVPPQAFHVMLKPRGAICNLDCTYCYYLSKERLYPNSQFRMSDEVLEEYTCQYIAAQQVPEVTFAWQGGEPMLMGLDFFKRAFEMQEKYRPSGMRIHNTIQTNGVLLDDEWARFFKRHDVLVGLSIDGPRELHDYYRVDKRGAPTFDKVIAGLDRLNHYGVDVNILTTLHAANADHPLDVYHFLRDEAGAQFIQFIPIVERDNATGFQEGNTVTDRSIKARQYGDFLTTVFDDWVRNDVGRVFVQIFDVALSAWSGMQPGLCIFAETCGAALAMEHTGDLYSCDHFVEPKHKLGNIHDVPLTELVGSEQQRQFGLAKRETLPRYCRECEVRFVCNGGCPKNCFIRTPAGEPGLNYLCAGYKSFFTHIDEPMQVMVTRVRAGRPAALVMQYMARKDAEELERQFDTAGRNDPCPCGSGRKFKRCHGR